MLTNMIEQKILTDRPYSVFIGEHLLSQAGNIFTNALSDLSGKTIVIISDSSVMPLYGQAVIDSFKNTSLNALSYLHV